MADHPARPGGLPPPRYAVVRGPSERTRPCSTLSPVTVKIHANHATTKLGARDRAQLVVLAYQAGLTTRPRSCWRLGRPAKSDVALRDHRGRLQKESPSGAHPRAGGHGRGRIPGHNRGPFRSARRDPSGRFAAARAVCRARRLVYRSAGIPSQAGGLQVAALQPPPILDVPETSLYSFAVKIVFRSEPNQKRRVPWRHRDS